MKLKTQFTVPHKQLRDLDYVNKVSLLEETIEKECIYYPNLEDCLVCCEWLDYSLLIFLLLADFNNIHKIIHNRG